MLFRIFVFMYSATITVYASSSQQQEPKAMYGGKEVPSTNPKSFKVVKENIGAKGRLAYGKDDKNVFYLGELESKVLSGADPKTFHVLGDSSYHTYAKDKKSVYSDFERVDGADASTFVLVGPLGNLENYGKDKSSVFFREDKIPGADPMSFTLLDFCEGGDFGGPPYAKDKNSVYYHGKKIQGADAATFKIVDCELYSQPGGDRVDARDAKVKYKNGKALK